MQTRLKTEAVWDQLGSVVIPCLTSGLIENNKALFCVVVRGWLLIQKQLLSCLQSIDFEFRLREQDMLLPHTFTEWGFPWPATVTSADSVLRSSSQVEPILAGVDQRVPQSWQVHGSHIHVAGGLRLSARMGWEMVTSAIKDPKTIWSFL